MRKFCAAKFSLGEITLNRLQRRIEFSVLGIMFIVVFLYELNNQVSFIHTANFYSTVLKQIQQFTLFGKVYAL